MANFPRKYLELFPEFAGWIRKTFALKDHTHDGLELISKMRSDIDLLIQPAGRSSFSFISTNCGCGNNGFSDKTEDSIRFVSHSHGDEDTGLCIDPMHSFILYVTIPRTIVRIDEYYGHYFANGFSVTLKTRGLDDVNFTFIGTGNTPTIVSLISKTIKGILVNGKPTNYKIGTSATDLYYKDSNAGGDNNKHYILFRAHYTDSSIILRFQSSSYGEEDDYCECSMSYTLPEIVNVYYSTKDINSSAYEKF